MGLAIGNAIGVPFGGMKSWASSAMPTGLTVTDIVGGIRLTWEDKSSDEDGFEIWISVDGAAYYLLATVAANVETYDDMSDHSGYTVQYKVRAYKGTAYSDFSDESSITIVEIPYLNKPIGNEYAFVADNGGLDIGNTGLTFAMWVKGTSATAPPTTFWLGGKHIFGGNEGRYGITADQTTGFYSSYTNLGAGSNGEFYIDKVKIGADIMPGGMARTSAVTIQDEVWHFLLLRLGATSAGLANQFEFYLGSGNDATGAGVTLTSKCAIARAIVYKSQLSVADCNNLADGIIKAGYAAYWKFGAYPLVDETGNFNLTGVNLSGANLLTTPTLP